MGVLIEIGIVLAALAFFTAAFWQGLTVRPYSIETKKVSAAVRLAVLTDLHSSRYGNKQETLIHAIQEQNPDLVLFAGDIADDKLPHDNTKLLLAAIGNRYPCYYVTGNHEIRTGEVEKIKEMFRSYGVIVLEGAAETVMLNQQPLRICGVDDPSGFSLRKDRIAAGWKKQFQACQAAAGDGVYTVLLSHHPELTAYYRDSGFDLVLAGHAHGGQVRIPGILNGLFAPHQGIFPAYAGGRYQLGGTTLIVSRGLCRNHRPRVFNPPELVIVDLLPASEKKGA
ncbi:metallophosphoesterase [Anaeromassilibacillus senegalensis]|uniref:metallophosphoesterase n=1 Tax=Anaeromassilibacillus senegalensis TaxID=1673717 RepID=UPI00068147D1|nr:metallophosphoesterase [Anaeromassilibacillus senegalensis]